MRIEQDLYKALSPYIIEAALPMVMERLSSHAIRFDFSDRSGRILGFYRGQIHRMFKRAERRIENRETISLQISLNPYTLLLVFIHEWAHLLTHWHYPQAQPHGKEWKRLYRQEAQGFLRPDIFPPDMLEALTAYFTKPGAYWDDRLVAACAPYGKDRKAFERLYKRLAKKGTYLPAPVTYRLAYGQAVAKRKAVKTEPAAKAEEARTQNVAVAVETEAVVKPRPGAPVSTLRRAAAGTLTLPVRVKVQERWARLDRRKDDYLTGCWEDTGKAMRVHALAEVSVSAEGAAG
ncbi:MAG: SprT-like domain-containing protein [Bacteroidales bacterium]|nr:SprT-like domain-containing protein [Bacteroidales bacterium]